MRMPPPLLFAAKTQCITGLCALYQTHYPAHIAGPWVFFTPKETAALVFIYLQSHTGQTPVIPMQCPIARQQLFSFQ